MLPSDDGLQLPGAPRFRLDSGPHDTSADGMCAMELVAWIAGEGHTDRPACACPVLTELVQGLNDGMDDDDRELLIPYALDLAHSRADAATEARRSALAAEWLRHEAPRFRGAQGEWFVRCAVAAAADGDGAGAHSDAAWADLDGLIEEPVLGSRRRRRALHRSALALLEAMLALTPSDRPEAARA